jgi:hypothetical protein
MALSLAREQGGVVDGIAEEIGYFASDAPAVGAGGRNGPPVLPKPEGVGGSAGFPDDRILQLHSFHIAEAVPDFRECSCVCCHFCVALFLNFVCTFTFAKIEKYFQKKKDFLEYLASIFPMLS